MNDYLSPVGKLKTWLVYGTLQGLVDFQRDYGLDCRGCEYGLQGESSIYCRWNDEEVMDYRIAEECEGHRHRA